MSSKQSIITAHAPQPIGAYSQAIRIGSSVYLSGQIALVPETMKLVEGDITAEINQVFTNLQAVAKAAGGKLDDLVKLTVYLTDLQHFPLLNEIMQHYFTAPYPARAVVQVAALPKGAQVEIDAVMCLPKESY